MGGLGRWRRRVRFYGNCPACGHDWREHPGAPHVPGVECSECAYEVEHEERPPNAGPLCIERAAAPREDQL